MGLDVFMLDFETYFGWGRWDPPQQVLKFDCKTQLKLQVYFFWV